jgi:hypothetical protein
VHQKPKVPIGWRLLAPLVWNYLLFWVRFWTKNFYRLPRFGWRILERNVFRRELWLQ